MTGAHGGATAALVFLAIVGLVHGTGTPGAVPGDPVASGDGAFRNGDDARRDEGEIFRPSRASFSLVIRGLEMPFRRFFVSALPGEAVEIRVAGATDTGTGEGTAAGTAAGGRELRRFGATADGRSLEPLGPGTWRWTAPDRSGRQRIVIRRRAGEGAGPDSVVLQAFVLVPRSRLEDGSLDGYRMGTFPTPAYRGLEQYGPPPGYIRLTRENASVRVSPHFRLGQFPVKRPRGWPKYLPLGPELVLKLEIILEEANRRGIRASGFTVMSAYRSPWYNTELLGRPRYSRHIYGDAADVFVDENGDGAMDDLNGDGRITVADADLLYRMVDEMDRTPATRHLRGGLWKYRRTASHPPFIHVDTRGFIAR